LRSVERGERRQVVAAARLAADVAALTTTRRQTGENIADRGAYHHKRGSRQASRAAVAWRVAADSRLAEKTARRRRRVAMSINESVMAA